MNLPALIKHVSSPVRVAVRETLAMLRPALICLNCRAPHQRSLALCEACEADLPWQLPGCERCGVALDTDSSQPATLPESSLVTRLRAPGDAAKGINTNRICLNCQHKPPHFDCCTALFAYQPPVSGLIKRFKEHAGFSEARCLGGLMSAAFQQYYFEKDLPAPAFLLPVPLHYTRIRQRGFNQAQVLCSYISRSSGIAVLPHACERHAAAHTQRGLSAQARQLNMRGIFYAGKQAHLTAGQHIAIIDDVVTTAATVNAMSGVLREHGVSRIDIWSLARANNPTQTPPAPTNDTH